MYLPRHFDASAQADHYLPLLLARDPFITLVSQGPAGPEVSHLPVRADRDAAGHWVLSGHWARANPQWQTLEGQRALAIVHGPHAYISPGWYPDPAAEVPTWNYVALHAKGRVERVSEPDAVLALVGDLSAVFEDRRPKPWRLADSDPALSQMARGIVGFRLHLDQIEVKLKLNQHHDKAHLDGAIAGLRESEQAGALELAEWMAQVRA